MVKKILFYFLVFYKDVYFIIKGRVIVKSIDDTGKWRTAVYIEGSYFGDVIILKIYNWYF